MNTDIRYIFLDLGGTFRVIDEDPAYLAAARAKIAELCGVKTEDPTQWFEDVIDKRYDVYREWALKYMCEAPEEVLWRRWLAYDCDPELIRHNASELCYQYRQTKGRRTVVEGGADTVKELCRRGYTLGIISDLVGRREVDEWLDQDGLRPYFQTVQQSSVTYIRKPGPAILLLRHGGSGSRTGKLLLCGRQSEPGYHRRQGRRFRYDRHGAVPEG